MQGRLRALTALIVLTLVGAANALDRFIIGMVLPSIRSEFHVGDAFLGFLSGPTFAITYAVCGVPLAFLADRIGRRKVIAGALAFFSATTLACGLAGSFWQLVVARLATGAGEAGTTSPCNALVAEFYPEDRRDAPLAIFAAAGNIGLVMAFFGGGWTAEHYGWRAVFMGTAAFGAFALLAFCLFFPAREQGPRADDAPLWPGLMMPLADPAMRWVMAGAAIASIGGYAASAFVPSFLSRSHHMSPIAIGTLLAILAGTIGWAGTAFPGLVANRWASNDPGIALKISSAAMLCALPFHSLFYIATNLWTAVVAAIPAFFVGAIFLGPSFAAVQYVAPTTRRAQAASLLLLAINLVGLGLGPQLVGLISHTLQSRFGEDALRYALAIVVTAPVIPAACCFWLAARTLRQIIKTPDDLQTPTGR